MVTKSPTKKEQKKVSPPKEKISGGKTSSSSTTVKKRRMKQEARKNRNICNSIISSEYKQMQAPPTTEPEKLNVSAREESKASEPEKVD